MKLRDYQRDVVDRVNASDGAPLAVLPTGAGKTTIGAELCRGRERVLWVAHRTELIDQARERLSLFGVHNARIISAQSIKPSDDLACDIAILDEAHHYPKNNMWTEAADIIKASGAKLVGLTATPQRSDGRGLGGTFDCIVQGPSPFDMVRDGHLCDVDVFSPGIAQGGFAMNPRDAWVQYADNRRTVVFCSSIASAEREREVWGDGEVIHGKLSAAERARRLASPWRVLFNVFVLTEGWDLPEVKCAILARGCGSVGTYLQIAGRILRPHPSYDRAVLIDLVGASREHGHPLDDREWSLVGTGGGAVRGGPSYAYCAACSGLLNDAASTCDRCGHARENAEARERKIELAKLERVMRNSTMSDSERGRRLAAIVAQSRARGYSPGWVQHRYRALFGVWPSHAQMRAAGARV